MTCEPIDIFALIDIIYIALATGNFEFKCKERSYGIPGETFGTVLHHICNIWDNILLHMVHYSTKGSPQISI